MFLTAELVPRCQSVRAICQLSGMRMDWQPKLQPTSKLYIRFIGLPFFAPPFCGRCCKHGSTVCIPILQSAYSQSFMKTICGRYYNVCSAFRSTNSRTSMLKHKGLHVIQYIALGARSAAMRSVVATAELRASKKREADHFFSRPRVFQKWDGLF